MKTLTTLATLLLAMVAYADLGDVKMIDPAEFTEVECQFFPSVDVRKAPPVGCSHQGDTVLVSEDCDPLFNMGARDTNQLHRVRKGNVGTDTLPTDCSTYEPTPPGRSGSFWLHFDGLGDINQPPVLTATHDPAPCGQEGGPFHYVDNIMTRGLLAGGEQWGAGTLAIDPIPTTRAILLRMETRRRFTDTMDTCVSEFAGSWCNGTVRMGIWQTTEDTAGKSGLDGQYFFSTSDRPYGNDQDESLATTWEVAFAVGATDDPISLIAMDSTDGTNFQLAQACVGTWSGSGVLTQEAALPVAANGGAGGQSEPYIHLDSDADEIHNHQEAGGYYAVEPPYGTPSKIGRRYDGLFSEECVTNPNGTACSSCLDADVTGPFLHANMPDGVVDQADIDFVTACNTHTVGGTADPCDIADIPLTVSAFTPVPRGDGVVNQTDIDAVEACEGWNCGDEATCDRYTGMTDSDGDDVPDVFDNCSSVDQSVVGFCDSDGDGYGNACDADYNDDGFHTGADPGPFVALLQAQDLEADMNCDGFATGADASVFNDVLGATSAPGPSGLDCAGTAPCPGFWRAQ